MFYLPLNQARKTTTSIVGIICTMLCVSMFLAGGLLLGTTEEAFAAPIAISQGVDRQLSVGSAALHAADTTDAESAKDALTSSDAQIKPSVRYRAKTKAAGWQSWKSNNAVAGRAGKNQKVTSLQIALGANVSGSIKYRVRPTGATWSAWKADGAATQTFGSIEAVQVELSGAIAKNYSVVYRINAKGVGWQKRVFDGKTAGAVGKRMVIRALRIDLVAKNEKSGWVGSGTSWRYYKNGTATKGAWIDTAESPINVLFGTAKGKKRYWLDANGKLAVDRIVDPKESVDAAAGYAAYASNKGYPRAGKYAVDAGYVFAKKSGALYAKSRWLLTKAYDKKKQKYRLESVGSYAVAQTGMFKVAGKKYYGIPETGYVMRSNTTWLENAWYYANSKGVIKKSSKKVYKILEKYVKWAISIADNDSHGYSQAVRWGPDYDCSSLVISSLRKAGLSTGSAIYTGNMISELTKHGFSWHTDLSKLRRGDILLVHNAYRQHTEIYIGNGMMVGARISENGGIYGKKGDQTGHEIEVHEYSNLPWGGFLRLRG